MFCTSQEILQKDDMINKKMLLLVFLIAQTALFGQADRWAPEKAGKWRYETNLPDKGYKLKNSQLTKTESIEFKKNVASVAEWFRQNNPMLTEPKGYDMRALSNYTWSDYSTITEGEYGIPAEMSFIFELFGRDGKKWVVEPPQYGFYINNIAGGHHGWYFTPDTKTEDSGRYNKSQAAAVEKATEKLVHYFPVFPLIAQPFPGVNIYEVAKDGGTLITIFNPDRPPFWLPVTVKELADASLEYYSLLQNIEIDRMLLAELKKEIAAFSPEELAAPAFMGHDANIVLRVNGKGNGLQVMRFNPEYWDKSLPRSAIQFMGFWDGRLSEEVMEENLKRRGYPDYPQLFVNKIKWNEVANLIMKR